MTATIIPFPKKPESTKERERAARVERVGVDRAGS